PGGRLYIDGGLQVLRNLHILDAVIGAIPPAVGLGRVDLPQPLFGHTARFDQAGDIVDIDLAPDAPSAARRVALEKALLVEALADSIDPAPAKRHVDGFHRADRF